MEEWNNQYENNQMNNARRYKCSSSVFRTNTEREWPPNAIHNTVLLKIIGILLEWSVHIDEIELMQLFYWRKELDDFITLFYWCLRPH